MNNNPALDGFKGLVSNWRNDLIAAVSVALVALPLCLGIAIASGFPPISGLITSIIGGLVVTLYRGSHVGINGPSAGIIAVLLTAIGILNDGSGQVLNYITAAILVSGILQILLGLFKLGKYADLFPSTVINGILAAIGVIIIAKQAHVALGTSSNADNMLGVLIDVVKNVGDLNPFLAMISITGLILLIFHSKISYNLFKFLPAPLWVLVISIPFVYIFNFEVNHFEKFLGRAYEIGPHQLIQIPDDIFDSFLFFLISLNLEHLVFGS